jgi:large subunit ribosomal protein L18
MRNLEKKSKQKLAKYARRKHRVNLKIKNFSDKPRVIINKSNMYIKAQVVTIEGKVVASVIDKSFDGGTKTQRAENAGLALSDKLLKAGISDVSFDRN